MVGSTADHKENPGWGPGLKSHSGGLHQGALATLQDAVSDRDGVAKAREMLTAIKATTKTKSLAMCRSDTTPLYVASFVPSAESLRFPRGCRSSGALSVQKGRRNAG